MRRDLEVVDALAQLGNAGGYFRHISASARSAWVGNDKPFCAEAEKKKAAKEAAFDKNSNRREFNLRQ
jgi:predicted RNA-binding protein YlxR (DUF448 family)